MLENLELRNRQRVPFSGGCLVQRYGGKRGERKRKHSVGSDVRSAEWCCYLCYNNSYMFVMLPIFSIIMFVYGVRSDEEC